jgi:hypothetical protein
MKFTVHVLEKIFWVFYEIIKKKGFGLSLATSRNVFTQIFFNKNYSSAIAQANKDGSIYAGNISVKSICVKFSKRNRNIDASIAIELISETIRDELPNISEYFSILSRTVGAMDNTCLTTVFSERITGIGLIQGHIAGYQAVSNFLPNYGEESEINWIRSNSLFVVDVANFLGGVTLKRGAQIYFENMNVSFDKEDLHFMSFMAKSYKEIGRFIAKAIAMELSAVERDYWEDEISFDRIKNILLDVLDDQFRNPRVNWLNAECNAATAVVNNIAGEIRETLRMLSNDDNFYQDCSDVESTIAQSANFAARQIFNLRNTVSTALS